MIFELQWAAIPFF